ncbi:MAG TPA: hypothetical protein ENJ38_06240 [Rhodospirillales bacterium]|nr:hypothetical protein [Rhodospirillales bacterium]
MCKTADGTTTSGVRSRRGKPSAPRASANPTTEEIMTRTKLYSLVLAGGALLALGGCASRTDIEALRSEIAGVRATAQAADEKATQALAKADQAAADAAAAKQEAAMASEKADRIFRAGLRK